MIHIVVLINNNMINKIFTIIILIYSAQINAFAQNTITKSEETTCKSFVHDFTLNTTIQKDICFIVDLLSQSSDFDKINGFPNVYVFKVTIFDLKNNTSEEIKAGFALYESTDQIIQYNVINEKCELKSIILDKNSGSFQILLKRNGTYKILSKKRNYHLIDCWNLTESLYKSDY